jgi:hypothetical protein
MIRSNVIRIIFFVFCCFAAQFHGSSANAQYWNVVPGTGTELQYPGNVVIYQDASLNEGYGACTGNGYCFWMWGEWGSNCDFGCNGGFDTIQLFDPYGNLLWTSPAWLQTSDQNGYWAFQTDGNFVVYDSSGNPNFATNTYSGNTATGFPGGAVVLDESAEFYIVDVNWNFLGCLWCNGYTTWGAE